MFKNFVVSDVHGHYDELIECLNEAGFDKLNPLHRVIFCGDYFDRGSQSLQVFNFIQEMGERAITIKGNHDEFLEQFLEPKGMSQLFNYDYNGFNKTLRSFLGENALSFEAYAYKNYDSGCMNTREGYFLDWQKASARKIRKEYPNLLPWLKNMPYFFETKNYIFVHGSIDTNIEDWHKSDWKSCVWDKGDFFVSDIKNTDKAVVIGHFATRHLRYKHLGLSKMDFDNPEYGEFDRVLIRDDKKIIAIDTCTILTKKINVFVIEDEDENFSEKDSTDAS